MIKKIISFLAIILSTIVFYELTLQLFNIEKLMYRIMAMIFVACLVAVIFEMVKKIKKND